MKIANVISAAALAACALPLTSCVTDELFNTSHPGHATIALTADWSERSDDAQPPASWRLAIGDYTAEETAATHASRHLFEPGVHAVAAWNRADNLTVSGTTVTVATDGESRAGAMISANPGWMSAYAGQLAVEADNDYGHTAVMKQLTRRLTVIIELTGSAAGEIASIDGRFEGAASSLDFASGVYGEAASLRLPFEKRAAEGGETALWSAEVRLLGVAGDSPTVSGTLLTTSGEEIAFESDLSAMFADFNSDKISPLAVKGAIRVDKKPDNPENPDIPDNPDNPDNPDTPDNPDEPQKPAGAGFTATIGGWHKVDAGNVDAH